MYKEHVCDERCRCPECDSYLYYSYTWDLHACSNPYCGNGKPWVEVNWRGGQRGGKTDAAKGKDKEHN